MKIFRSIAFIMMISILLLPAYAGCAQAPVEQVLICSEVSGSGEPKTVANTFPPDVEEIFCSVKLASVSPKSHVKLEWYIAKSEDGQYSDYLLGSETIATTTPYIAFGFVRSDKLLPKGGYQAKVYYDGSFIQAVPFTIKGEASALAAILSEAVMCTGIDLITGKPLDKVVIFPDDSSAIYCSAKITGASFGTNISARWIFVEGALEGIKNSDIYTASSKAEGKEYVSFSFGPSAGKTFPIGTYEVILKIEDTEQARLKFQVVDRASIPGPFVSEAITFTYSDEEKTKIDITGIFPTSINEVGLSARAYNVPPGTELIVRWILTRSDDAIYADYMLKEDKAVIEGTTPIIALLKRGENELPKGDYAVKIIMNGKDMVTVPFRVR